MNSFKCVLMKYLGKKENNKIASTVLSDITTEVVEQITDRITSKLNCRSATNRYWKRHVDISNIVFIDGVYEYFKKNGIHFEYKNGAYSVKKVPNKIVFMLKLFKKEKKGKKWVTCSPKTDSISFRYIVNSGKMYINFMIGYK